MNGGKISAAAACRQDRDWNTSFKLKVLGTHLGFSTEIPEKPPLRSKVYVLGLWYLLWD